MTDHTTDSPVQDIPHGFCQCGCGQKTKLVTRNSQTRGLAKGTPRRFVAGHSARNVAWRFSTERFWANITIGAPNDCWEWQAGKNKKGYGRCWMNGQKEYVHRISYKLHHGSIPDGMCILHECDNPACTNPAHLFLGTNTDNMEDKTKKGRTRWDGQGLKGESNPQAKITEDIARTIHERHKRGERQSSIAKELGISDSIVSRVILHKTWKDA